MGHHAGYKYLVWRKHRKMLRSMAFEQIKAVWDLETARSFLRDASDEQISAFHYAKAGLPAPSASSSDAPIERIEDGKA